MWPYQKPVDISADDLQATCDALTQGKKRGQREPHLVIGTESPSPSDKARLAFAGYALGQENRRRPSFGVIVPFTGGPKRVKLDPLYAAVSKSVDRPTSRRSCSPTIRLIAMPFVC